MEQTLFITPVAAFWQDAQLPAVASSELRGSFNCDGEGRLAQMPLTSTVLFSITSVVAWSVDSARNAKYVHGQQCSCQIRHEFTAFDIVTLQPGEAAGAVTNFDGVQWIIDRPTSTEISMQLASSGFIFLFDEHTAERKEIADLWVES